MKLKTLVFSFKRNLQLDAFVESLNLHCDGHPNLTIYGNDCDALGQGEFKRDVLDILDGSEYIFFCVDDTIFVNDFCLEEIIDGLEDKSVVGFSLRLGKNTTYCYMKDKYQALPEFEGGDILKYRWDRAEFDFGYPLEISSSIYRTKDIIKVLNRDYFWNPTMLEVVLHRNRYSIGKYYLMCYPQSVAFSAPFNKVQTVFPGNRSMKYSPDFFESLWDIGKSIDVEQYSGMVPNSAHQEVDLILKGE